MPELDPAALTERVLWIGRAAPFQQLGSEALALFSAAAREEMFSKRTILVHAGQRAAAQYHALTGRLRLSEDAGALAANVDVAGIGALSVLGGGVFPADLVAEAGTVLLVLDGDALLSVLEENGTVARAVLRALATRLLEVRHAGAALAPPTRFPVTSRRDLVARMLLLREGLRLGRHGMGMAAVARLARGAQLVRLPEGAPPWAPGQVADVVLVLEGELHLIGPGSSERHVGPGEVLGPVESVARLPMEEQATAAKPTTLLVLSHSEVRETVEDDDTLALELLRTFSAEIWVGMGGAPPPEDG